MAASFSWTSWECKICWLKGKKESEKKEENQCESQEILSFLFPLLSLPALSADKLTSRIIPPSKSSLLLAVVEADSAVVKLAGGVGLQLVLGMARDIMLLLVVLLLLVLGLVLVWVVAAGGRAVLRRNMLLVVVEKGGGGALR